MRSLLTIGRGDTYTGDYNGSPVLREVDVPIIPRETCATLFHRLEDTRDEIFADVDESMVCAGYIDNLKNHKDSCQGDSGGPLIDTKSGHLIGVTSWGSSECGGDGFVGVYARIGRLRSFIDSHMERRHGF